MNIVLLASLFFFFQLLEGSLLYPFLPATVIPDFLLIFVVCIAFLRGEKQGALVGFSAGLLQDILFSPAIGYFALVKMLVGYLVGKMGREIYREQVIAPVFLAFVFTFFHEGLIYLLVERFIGMEITFDWILRLLFIPKAFIHLFLAMIFYPLFYRAEQKRAAAGTQIST